jgi:hypothetical protein
MMKQNFEVCFEVETMLNMANSVIAWSRFEEITETKGVSHSKIE